MKYILEVKMKVEVEADDPRMAKEFLNEDFQEMTSDVVDGSVEIGIIGKANDNWDDRPYKVY